MKLTEDFTELRTSWRGSAARMSGDELRRTVYATTLLDLQQPLATILAELGITIEQLSNLGEPASCELLDMMPGRRADMDLTIQWAKNATASPIRIYLTLMTGSTWDCCLLL